jgi:PAS domain S-box-containing protein
MVHWGGEAMLAAIVESSDDAIISKDLEGIIRSWNRGAERIFGYTTGEAIGKPVAMLAVPDRVEEIPNIIQRIRRGEKVDHYETKRRTKDGRVLDISLTVSPIRNASGEIVGASKIARDITERKQLQAAVVASEARFRAAVTAVSSLIWSNDAHGQMEGEQAGWSSFTGQSYDEYRGYGWAKAVHPDDAQSTIDAWNEAVSERRMFVFEHRVRRYDGVYRLFSIRAVPVLDDNGAITEWVGVHTDITESQRAREALTRSNEELRRANADLEQFAFSASHDLKEPLRMVAIYSQLLQRKYSHRLDTEALGYLNNVMTGARRMDNLVQDLLAYTKSSTAVESEAVSSVDAEVVLQRAISNLTQAMEESGATIEKSLLPKLQVMEVHLLQLFQNIIENAIKYRRDEPPLIKVDATREGSLWRICVHDNGIGIAPEYREQVFGIFKRLHPPDKYSGTGIGLALCQRLVVRYGGRIWVESAREGKGSTICFTLPGGEIHS